MVCNRACINKRRRSETAGAPTLNPTMLLCAALPCVIQSVSFDQTCQLHSSHVVCVRVAQAWQTSFRGQCCHPHTCVYPDITNLSQSLYRHILLQCPHTFPHTQKPLKTLSRWSPTSSLRYCFNICRKSQHSKKELWESFHRLWRAAFLMLRGEFSWKAIRQVIHTRSRKY